MARLLRFFASDLDNTAAIGSVLRLNDEEAAHAMRVLRLQVGEKVNLFNGAGISADAEIVTAGKRDFRAKIFELRHAERPKSQIIVALAPMKRDFDEMLVRLAEIGVDRVIPIATRFGEVDLSRKDPSNYGQRMHKLAVRAAKQSGREFLIEIERQRDFREIGEADAVYFCAADAPRHLLATPLPDNARTSVLVIGSEGGFSPDEEGFARDQGWQAVGLGDGILRAGTACIVAAGILAAKIRN